MVMARCSPSAHTQELCAWLCVLHCSVSLGPLRAEGARLRCGSELLGDLVFVCGDRGIYLGRRGWSGYGPRPRSKGIVDQCCLGPGCDLHHLEKYCAKAKAPTTSSTQRPITGGVFYGPVSRWMCGATQSYSHLTRARLRVERWSSSLRPCYRRSCCRNWGALEAHRERPTEKAQSPQSTGPSQLHAEGLKPEAPRAFCLRPPRAQRPHDIVKGPLPAPGPQGILEKHLMRSGRCERKLFLSLRGPKQALKGHTDVLFLNESSSYEKS